MSNNMQRSHYEVVWRNVAGRHVYRRRFPFPEGHYGEARKNARDLISSLKTNPLVEGIGMYIVTRKEVDTDG